MTKGLRPYPAYKTTDVAWLGSVPEHWGIFRSKVLLREVDRRSASGAETPLSMSQKLGLVPSTMLDHRTLVAASFAQAKICEVDELVLNRLKAHLGVFSTSRYRGIVSPDYTVFAKTRPLSMSYVEHVLRSPACRRELQMRAKGIVEGFWRLYTDDFYQIRIPFPPLAEQELMVRYIAALDRKVAQFVRGKQRLIKLLEEQKQAILLRAVSGGLHPQLRDTGSRWLPRVPKHWEVLPLRRRWQVIDCKHMTVPFTSEGYPVASVREVRNFELNLSNAKRTDGASYSHMISGGRNPRRGDIVYCRNASVGACSYVATDEPFAMGQDVCLIRSDTEDCKYLTYFLRSTVVASQLASLKVGSTFDRINVAEIKDLTVAVPPKAEQQAIATALDEQTDNLGTASGFLRRQIELINAYRDRLVADIVTGKFDVRAAAARLPDVSELLQEFEAGGISDDLDDDAEDLEAEEAQA